MNKDLRTHICIHTSKQGPKNSFITEEKSIKKLGVAPQQTSNLVRGGTLSLSAASQYHDFTAVFLGSSYSSSSRSINQHIVTTNMYQVREPSALEQEQQQKKEIKKSELKKQNGLKEVRNEIFLRIKV
jgi:hypothetical protein